MTVRILVDYQARGEIHCDYATTLGAGGMFLETDLVMSRGEIVKVRFRIPGGDVLHEFEAGVTWHRTMRSNQSRAAIYKRPVSAFSSAIRHARPLSRENSKTSQART